MKMLLSFFLFLFVPKEYKISVFCQFPFNRGGAGTQKLILFLFGVKLFLNTFWNAPRPENVYRQSFFIPYDLEKNLFKFDAQPLSCNTSTFDPCFFCFISWPISDNVVFWCVAAGMLGDIALPNLQYDEQLARQREEEDEQQLTPSTDWPQSGARHRQHHHHHSSSAAAEERRQRRKHKNKSRQRHKWVVSALFSSFSIAPPPDHPPPSASSYAREEASRIFVPAERIIAADI